MNTDDPKEIILRAVDAFNRRMLVVSPQFIILAIRGLADSEVKLDVVGRKCYKVLYNRQSPCHDCPTLEVGRRREPALSPGYHPNSHPNKMPCLYSYPIFSGKEIDAFVMLDFDFPALFLLENLSLFQNIEIEKKFEDFLPPVQADIQQLKHLFMNIILNAAQAMDDRGHLTLKTCLDSGKNRVGIEISDSGPGISNDVIPYIFEPFYTTKEEGQGTGLGLSPAYGIVENHGGHITVRNKPDGGAVFCITLPVATGNSEGEQGAEN
jgi:hypothetical protein